MFIRTVETKSGGKTHRYLRVVENYRYNGRIKQRVLWNLGNLKKVRHKLPGLLKSLGNHSGEQLVPLRKLKGVEVREYGNMLLLKTIWKELGIDEVLSRNKTTERMRPYIMAAVLHRLQNPGGSPPLAEWSDRVYLPELDGRTQIDKRILRLFERLEKDSQGKALRVISNTARKKAASFCYITGLKTNALRAHGNQSRQKESLLVLLTAGGVPVAYGIYDGKSPLTFIRDVLADGSLGQGRKRTNIVFAANRSIVGDAATDFFNREGIPYTVFINRWIKKGIRKPLYKAGRGYVAQRIKTGGKKGPWTYVLFKKAKKSSRTKRPVECAFKTNVKGRTFLLKAVKARRELSHLVEYFRNITLPSGVSPRAKYKRGYIFICLLAYMLATSLDKKISRAGMSRTLTPLGLLDRLKDIKLVTTAVSGRRLNYVTKIPRRTRELLKAFDVKTMKVAPKLSR